MTTVATAAILVDAAIAARSPTIGCTIGTGPAASIAGPVRLHQSQVTGYKGLGSDVWLHVERINTLRRGRCGEVYDSIARIPNIVPVAMVECPQWRKRAKGWVDSPTLAFGAADRDAVFDSYWRGSR